MKFISLIIENKHARAWIFLVTTVALHVFDESVNGFLPLYNQSVLSIKQRIGFFPAPTFSFGIWLGGLIGGIVICYALTYFVVRGSRKMRVVTIVFGVLMVLNGLGHILGSIALKNMIPGIYSSPLLLAAAVLVIVQGFKAET